MGKYFGTDGVRGVANQELTPELAFKLGRYGGYVLAHNKGEKHPRVLVGRDTRVSGEMLESALIAGLISIGAEVMRLGIIFNTRCCIFNTRYGCRVRCNDISLS